MQEGKVPWNYRGNYGFRKGADGKPEIDPEKADIVRQIYAWYLAGYSLDKIIKSLYERNIPSPSNKEKWEKSTIQNLLENERICGDVILQKTFVEDPISKKVRKNNGELPKIYIQNNHPAIVERAVFEKVQLERSRRNSKPKICKKTSSEKGGYSSLYALSELLICAECGSPYRRVTWRKRNGEKQIVWRCINRLDHGKKYCQNSPTLTEDSLHYAVMTAISNSSAERKELTPLLTAQLEQILWEQADNGLDIGAIERQITEIKSQVLSLVSRGMVGENMEEIERLSGEAARLNGLLMEYKTAGNSEQIIRQEINEITCMFETGHGLFADYDNDLVRQLIHTIKISRDNVLYSYFKCGVEFEQVIAPGVRRLGSG